MIRPGEIYMADFASAGPHPVVVLSREQLNRGRYALVAVCTSARFDLRSKLPNCVLLHAGTSGLKVDCVVQCENLLSIEIIQLDLESGPLGTLDAQSFREVIRAIGYVMESECEPI